jgi:hypothetical protein
MLKLKKEFSELQQDGMTVNDYLNKFTQMSRYAPNEVNTDEKNQDAFLNGLNDEIQFQLLNTAMMISRRWSTRLSLSKTRSKRWRRMARGKHHSRDSLWVATPSLACLSQGLSSETQVWFICRCMDNVLHSTCNDQTFRRNT